MPRLQVYLPDELHRKAKELGLPASKLLQDAIRDAIRRRALATEMDRYLAGLRAEVGEPTKAQKARATAKARRILGKDRKAAIRSTRAA